MKYRGMKTCAFLGLACWAFLSASSFGQFHTKEQKGAPATVNNQAVNQAQQQAISFNADINEAGASYAGGEMVLSEGQRTQLARYNPRLGKMQGRQIEVWARRIEHSDGTYTESIESNEKEQSNSIEQITKSANGTTLQKRLVRLDRYKRPAEVLIRDGRGTFKYRGVMVYDQRGRFAEEQLFDANGTLIRRKVQEYTSDGFPKPVRSWDYVANVPEDLKLVITRQSESPNDVDRGSSKPKERKGLFAKAQGDAARANPSSVQNQAASVQATPIQNGSQGQASQPEKRKGLGLGRLFGAGNREN